MKISVVSSFFLPVPPVLGGAMEKIWFRLAQEFAAAGHEVTYFSRRWPAFPAAERLDGITMVRVPGFNHTRSMPRNLLLDLIWGLRVARRLPPSDIVACNTVALPAFLPWIRPAAGRVVAVLGRMPKGHAYFYGRVARLIATSEAVRDRVVAERAGLADRTRVVPNPIDWTIHQASRAKAPAGQPRTIGYVGRMNPEKGVEILLQAAAILARRPGLPAWRLRLIGPQRVAEGGGGEVYVESLRELARAAGAAVTLDAPIYDAAELARAYGEMDLFCYPSLAEKGEGLSVAPLEAMAAGAVPIVSALDCYRDVIRPGENGFTFDHRAPNRAELLADRFEALLRDPAECARLAAAAAAAARRFDYAVVAEELLADFRRLQRR
jgi:glycosyltransferase involved in cell wall biosynthesis